jgi:demethylmenaquinone methyltransferase / 2-methoxy-6-polyprenyl-1,4-benzoquinol methylase
MNDRVTGTHQSASGVREMFGRIAPRYDLLNHLLSCNLDRLWRAAVPREFRDVLSRPDARVLDLCCGTGDLALTLHDAGQAQIIGADFCHPMLVRAAEKLAAAQRRPPVLEADALQLPFADSSFDLITVAFGFRNLADYDAGLREMFRLLRPGGSLGILEFSEVSGLLGPAYRFYFSRVLPRLGGLISGDSGAYSYLPVSVERFPAPDELAARMRAVGFGGVRYRRLTFGVACLHIGSRAMV